MVKRLSERKQRGGAKEYFTWNNDKIEQKSRKNLRNLVDKWILFSGKQGKESKGLLREEVKLEK